MNDSAVPSVGGNYWDAEAITRELHDVRAAWRRAHQRNVEHEAAEFPSRNTLDKVMSALAGCLFPLRLGPSFVRRHNEDAYVAETLQTALSRLYGQIRIELAYARKTDAAADIDQRAGRIIADFAAALPALRRRLDLDVEAAYRGDPAARSVDEVLICYPSILAIIHHRLANHLHRLGAPVVARIVAEIAHSATGIDIHPGATIGASFFVDHGTGVVIGETAVIGDRVRLYQAVTLGARTFPTNVDGTLTKGMARHPIVEDDVVIYAGATILGRITIGRGAVIGGNVWLTESVPAGAVIHQAMAERNGDGDRLPQGHVNSEGR